MLQTSLGQGPQPRGRLGRRFFYALVPVCLSATVSVTGCFQGARPDLATIYSSKASYHDLERNPVVVIPGLIGTRLLDKPSGTQVWGTLGGDYASPKTPEGLRLLALPLYSPASDVPSGVTLDFSQLHDDVVPDGVLDRLKVRLLGIPLEINAYTQILQTLGVGGYRDPDLSLGYSGSVDYGSDHYTCFQFAYDWRRDLVESAKLLHGFLIEQRSYVEGELAKRFDEEVPPVKFDLVAHSMGGLVARYYLRYGAAELPADGSLPELTWAGAELVEKLVLVATPNAGALDAVVDLVEGRDLGFLLPRYPSAVLGTFPSAYQLLPRSRHHQMLESASKAPPAEGWKAAPGARDLLDLETWETYRWGLLDPDQEPVLAHLLPEVESAEGRRAIAKTYLKAALARARAFQAALDLPAEPPDGLQLHLVVGDSQPTPSRLAVNPGTGRVAIVEQAAGDGRVLRSSALMDERLAGPWQRTIRSPVSWTSVTFLRTNHLGLTRDPAFTDNVLYLLLEQPKD